MGFCSLDQNEIISFFSSKDVIQSDRNLLFKTDKPSLVSRRERKSLVSPFKSRTSGPMGGIKPAWLSPCFRETVATILSSSLCQAHTHALCRTFPWLIIHCNHTELFFLCPTFQMDLATCTRPKHEALK